MRQILLFVFIVGFLSSHAQGIDVQHYKFQLELSDASDAINGEATVTIKFLKPLNQFSLDLASLDGEKGMIAFDVSEKEKKLTTTQSADKLNITLGSPSKSGETRTFIIRYMGTPKDGLIISKNKFGDRTFFADNWPDRAHNWIPVNDRPDDKASFEFVVTAPSKYKVISNGELISTKSIASGKTQTHWKETTPLSTKIMVIGAADFAIIRLTGEPTIGGLWPLVTAWAYRKDSAYTVKDFMQAHNIERFFSQYIAPYPYKKLANVQSTTIFGGMENASAIFYDENRITGEGKIVDLIAHEMVHQWFGNMASEKNFAHLWLSEGFATYLTNYYFEKTYGADTANKRLREEREQVIRFAEKSSTPVVDSVSSYMELLNANSYQKGGWVLHMLRREVGDTVFQNILRKYYNTYKGSNADTRDFQAVVESVTNKNWRSFFDQWLYTPGVPVVRVLWKKEKDKLTLTVKQTTKKLFEFPLTVGCQLANGQMLYRTIRVSKESELFEFPLTENPVNLLLDPFTNLLFKGTVSKE